MTFVGGILQAGDMEDVLSVYKDDGGVLHIDSKFNPSFLNITTGFDMTVYLPLDSMVDLNIKLYVGRHCDGWYAVWQHKH